MAIFSFYWLRSGLSLVSETFLVLLSYHLSKVVCFNFGKVAWVKNIHNSTFFFVLSPDYEPLTFAWLNQHSAHWAIALASLMVLSHLLFLCVQLHKLILESVYRLWAQCVMATQHEPSSRCSWAEGTRVAPIINGRVVKLECKHKKVEAYTWWEDKERKCNNCFSSAPSICSVYMDVYVQLLQLQTIEKWQNIVQY